MRDDAFDEFERFENAAFRIMHQHEGQILNIQKYHGATDGQPHEIHTIEFPDVAAFEAYKADPSLLELAQLRSKCIARTEVSIDD